MQSIKTIILIDGDNINENYTLNILKEAECYVEANEHFEIHCFGDFVKRKQSWRQAYYEYGVQLHYIPSTDKQKGKPDPNTSDIALTSFAVKKFCENPDLQVCIIVANDKDYAPLSKMIMEEFHKKTVMFYTQPNDTAAAYYSEAVLLKLEEPVSSKAKDNPSVKSVETEENDSSLNDFMLVMDCILEQFRNAKIVLLSELGPILKDKGIQYGRSLGKYLENLFSRFPVLKEKFILRLGDKKDRIESVV